MMKIEQIALSGFGIESNGEYKEGHKFGFLEVDSDAAEAKIVFDKTKKDSLEVNHPTLGKVPHYKAVIHDVCMKAAELLIKRVEE